MGTLDILLEDNLAMAALLSSAGGEVDVRAYPRVPPRLHLLPDRHGAAVRGIEPWLADRLLGK